MSLSASLMNSNNALASLSQQAGKNITNAVYSASKNTGVDFGYLMQQAKVESSFDTDAKAKTSSASGLYQFINATWMNMVDKYGEKYGIESDLPRNEKLALRHDPKIAANMAAEFASENQTFLNQKWGGEVGSTELYLAHFLGAGGAASFLKAKDENPLQPAADIFGNAAQANKTIFFDKVTQRPKTIQEIYDTFAKKFEDIPQTTSPRRIIASTPNTNTPLLSFSERITAQIQTASFQQSALDVFGNVPTSTSSKMLSMNSLDFLSLFGTI